MISFKKYEILSAIPLNLLQLTDEIKEKEIGIEAVTSQLEHKIRESYQKESGSQDQIRLLERQIQYLQSELSRLNEELDEQKHMYTTQEEELVATKKDLKAQIQKLQLDNESSKVSDSFLLLSDLCRVSWMITFVSRMSSHQSNRNWKCFLRRYPVFR
jgi:hypothetical protein